MKKLLSLALVTMLLTACSGASRPAEAPSINRFVLTAEEMRAQNLHQATEAVRLLRPLWRGARVYNDPAMATLSGLHNVPEGSTLAVVYYPPLEAQTRFGMDHSGGAINILLPGGSLP